ncbi:response regulator [Xylanibacillus composti]|uniref:Response regulator n=1 Tax=Xylanibacillus composti TaxID=1572762 RepID=A0A8J4M2U6_9BACL|nr:response regulator [Xylanibacillus composti]MDT9727221.1 response regulator [Xylanibacillus composti]GIQ68901.1 hypothetical protein XYCOK13_17250 [Xylanibacillus composti]
MNILIVDDEQHVRDAIRLLVDWEAFGIRHVYEATNGEEAIQLIEAHRPEIVVTDMMMPIKGGIDLLAWMEEHANDLKRIVVSGYDDFQLVRSTMKHGGLDYILKPIDPDELAAALAKAKQAWEADESSRKQLVRQSIQMNQFKPAYWDKLFSSLIHDPHQPPSVMHALESEFQVRKGQSCHVAVISLALLDEAVARKYQGQPELLCFTLTNICNELLREENSGYACRYWGSEQELLLFYWGEGGSQGSLADGLDRQLRRMQHGFYLTLQARFDTGIGLACSFPDGVFQSYEEARQALRQRNIRDKGPHVCWFHADGWSAEDWVQPFAFEESFRLALQSASLEEIEAAADKWVAAVDAYARIPFGQLEQWMAQLEQLEAQFLHQPPFADPAEAGESAVKPPELPKAPWPFDEDRRFSSALWKRTLAERLMQIAQYWAERNTGGKNVIREIARYIDTHYSQEITLQDISSHFYLSREYISRKFKQETGENISEYIGRVRMEHAKLLLKNPALKVAQIAEMVGYTDEKYFSKVFRKLVGVSPNQYRKAGQ